MPRATSRRRSNLTVGGDWYEVIDLGEGRRALIVGDCVGHGLEAATAMGALRNVSRALLSEGRGPAEVINSLHRFATTMPAAFCATVVCAIVDLRSADDHVLERRTPAAAARARRRSRRGSTKRWPRRSRSVTRSAIEGRIAVRPGDLLVLYTDGLVERPGRGPRRRTRDGCAMPSLTRRDDSVQQIAERLIEQLVDDPPRDDIALVVKRIH